MDEKCQLQALSDLGLEASFTVDSLQHLYHLEYEEILVCFTSKRFALNQWCCYRGSLTNSLNSTQKTPGTCVMRILSRLLA